MVGVPQGESSISDLIGLHKLLREEAKAEDAKTWLMEPRTILELFVGALVSRAVCHLFLALLARVQ